MAELLNPPIYDKPVEEDDSRPSIFNNDQDFLSNVLGAYEEAERFQNNYFSLFRDLWRLFRFYKDTNSTVRVFNPIGFSLAVGILGKLFIKTPSIILTARKGGWRWLAKMLQVYIEYQLSNPDAEEPIEESFIDFLTELIVTGTAVGRVRWVTRFENRYVDTPEGRATETVKAFDDPVFEYIPLESVYFQPGAKEVSDSRYVIMEKYVDRAYLEGLGSETNPETGEPLYKNIDEAIANGSGEVVQGGIDDEVTNAKKPKLSNNSSENKDDRYHLMEYWEDNLYGVIIGKKYVIRGPEDNPFNHGKKPFIKMSYTRVPGEFYGVGALEPVSDLQKVINITLSQRVEYVSNLLNQQFAVLDKVDVDEEAIIEGYPIVHVTSMDAVAPLNKGSIPQASFLTNQELLSETERGMGISGYNVGAPAAAADRTQGTATGVQTIVAEANVRFEMLLRRFENVVLRKVASLYLDLNRQYFPEFEKRVVQITEQRQEFNLPLTKELFSVADWYIAIVPGSTGSIDKRAKLNEFMAWSQYGAGLLPNFNRQEAVLEAAEMQDIGDPERFILPEQAAPQPLPQPLTQNQ